MAIFSGEDHTLQNSFGADDKDWWVKGVPSQVRVECSSRRELDGLKEEPFRYASFIDFKTIIDKNWEIFQSRFKLILILKDKSKKDLLSMLVHANEIRNKVAHTIRSKITNEELDFLRTFCKDIEEFTKI